MKIGNPDIAILSLLIPYVDDVIARPDTIVPAQTQAFTDARYNCKS